MQGCLKLPAITLVIFLAPALASGQTPPAGGKPKAAPDYSKEAFTIEKSRTVASFENGGTSIRTVTEVVRVLSEAGVQHWGLLATGYSSANEQVEFGYVRVRKADGTVVETPADSAQDVTSEVMRLAPMYSDYREKHLAVKGLGVGDVLEYQITTRLQTPLIPGHFWFAHDFEKMNIVLDEELEVNVPLDRQVIVKSPDLKPVIVEAGNRRLYTWKTANLESRKNDEPKPIFPPPAVLLSTFKNWEELGRWWDGLEQQALAPTPEIRAKAAELTRDAPTREEKVQALYKFVATRFRYISISFGIGRYQPHAALDVLKNEYGDCKDKHTLLASLLQAVGIQAYPVLMNSARQVDPDVPSPGQFDHLVSAVPLGPESNKLIWLDTTTEVAPVGFLTFNLRDKRALLIPSSGPPWLVTTPADPPLKSFKRFEIDAKLSEAGVLEGKMQRSCRGDTEVLLRLLFRQTPQSQWKDLVQAISRGSGFAGEVSEVEADSPEATSEPFHFSNKYTRKDYPDWPNHRISPPVGFIGLPEIEGDTKRTQPILLGPPGEFTSIAKVELPKNSVPNLLPHVDLVRDFAEYHSRYSFKDRVFVTEVRLIIKKSEVPLSALDEYKSFQKAVRDDQSRYTELSSGWGGLFTILASSNAEATTLLGEAIQAFQRRDLDGASKSLKRALELDEHYEDAWLMLGRVRLAQGRTEEGLATLRKAIAVDPKDTRGYDMLGFAYMGTNRSAESVPVWWDLIKQYPNDWDAHANLGNALLGVKRYKEAVPELETAVARGKDSSSLEFALATAYLGAGSSDKALPLLKKVGEETSNPVTWNYVAYALADNNLNLSEAQRYAEKAVKEVEAETAHVSLEKLDITDLNRMTGLASFWDTLGWVYFHQGELAQAQRYLEAAWNLWQTRLVGEHLAQTYQKQGKKEAADHQNALADELTETDEFASSSKPREGATKSTNPWQETAGEELAQMRRTRLGPLSIKQGSAEFFVLLVPGGKVEALKFISGDAQLRSLSKALSSLKFNAPLPDQAPVKLLRRAMLVCPGSNFSCDFTFLTIDSVNSTK